MTAGETILWGGWIDYSQAPGITGLSYGGGGTIAGSALAGFEANIGKQCSIVHISGKWWASGAYAPWSNFQTNVNTLITAGRMVLMEWHPWDFTNHTADQSLNCISIIAGTHDAYITQFATDIKAWGKPIILRMMHEQNLSGGGTQFPWQYGPTGSQSVTFGGNTWTNTVAQNISAWQHVVNIFKNVVGCQNAEFVWCPNVRATSDVLTYAQMYPGSAYIDWLGLDGYPFWPNMTEAQEYHGAPSFPGGGNPGFVDSYAQVAALDPVLPIMICETGWNGVGIAGSQTITSISAAGGVWTVTTSGAPVTSTNQPNTGWAATQGVQIVGSTPSGYSGQWTIASNISSNQFTITNAATPGAYSASSATATLIDRIARANSVTQSLEVDFPAMPRVRALVLFWTLYSAAQWTMDYSGSQPNNLDMLALKSAMGGARYLAGSTMGTDLSARSGIPFQDQPMLSPNERYLAVLKSTTGLEGLWLLNDTVGSATVADRSGKNRIGTVNGTTALGSANVMPAEPLWTSASFPGVAGSNIVFANNAAYSPITTGFQSMELSFTLPSTPTAQGCLFGKASFTAGALFEWMIWASATQFGVTLWQSGGSTFASLTRSLPVINVPHHVIVVVDLSSTNKFVLYFDGVLSQGTFSAGTMSTSGSSTLMLGQRTDGTAPLPAAVIMGPVAIASTAFSAETSADHYAVWTPGPVISSISAVVS